MREKDTTVLQKAYFKKSSCPLRSETEWAKNQAWDYLQEICSMAREALEALVPGAK